MKGALEANLNEFMELLKQQAAWQQAQKGHR